MVRRPTIWLAAVGSLIALVGLAAPASASPSPAPPAQTRAGGTQETKIINGRAPSPGEFGYMVALGDRSRWLAMDLYQAQFCGGTLVSSTLVVTAAHCVVDRGSIRSGSSTVVGAAVALSSPSRVVGVSSITPHPSYNENTTENDVAVIRLSSPLTGVRTLKVTNRAEATTLVRTGQPVRSAGWGTRTAGGNDFPDDFLVADLRVLPSSVCGGGGTYVWGGVTFQSLPGANSAVMFCAGGVTSLGAIVDTCQGDSGGPVVSGSGTAARLVGVVSWGDGCGRTTPGAYTRLSTFTGWLRTMGVPINLEPDHSAPVVVIFGTSAARGVYAYLPFKSSDASRRTKERVIVRNAARQQVWKYVSAYATTIPNTRYVYRYFVPSTARAGSWSWCLQSIDVSGNASPLKCAPLTIR